MCHLNAYDDYRERFLKKDPFLIAELTGGTISENKDYMSLHYYNKECRISLKSGEITSDEFDINASDKIIIWNYLVNSRGFEPTGEWIGFLNFPDAQNHQQMFKGSVLEPIARTFGSNPEAFSCAAEALGGEAVNLGDKGYVLHVFPKIALAVSIYFTDDEFPASATVVFDSSVMGQINSPNIYALSGELAKKLCV